MATFGKQPVDYSTVKTSGDLIPAGNYNAIIIESGGKPNDQRTCEDGLVTNKAGTGRYLPMTFEIIDGDFKGKQIYKNFNLENQNEQAVSIARAEIKELLTAVGWNFVSKPCGPDDTSEIHNVPISIQVVIRNNKGSGEDQNEIRHFRARTAPGMTSAGTVSPAMTATSTKAPWQR